MSYYTYESLQEIPTPRQCKNVRILAERGVSDREIARRYGATIRWVRRALGKKDGKENTDNQ